MRTALISDIHANAVALDAVVCELETRHISVIACAGDLVGYNCFPRETLAICRARGVNSVCGRHDLLAAGIPGAEPCGPRARRAAAWTHDALTPMERAELAALPRVLDLGAGVFLMHAGNREVETRLGRVAALRAEAAFVRAEYPTARACVIGHSHEPSAVHVAPDGVTQIHRDEESVRLSEPGLWFINPGSVGEPRGADLRASYAVIEWTTWTVTFHRVEYDAAFVAAENARRLPPLEADVHRPRLFGRLRARSLAGAR